MPVDNGIVGYRQAATIDVERGRLRMFAAAIGEPDAVYHDLDAARAAGHPDLPALPTALFGLDLETSDTFEVLAKHGVDLDNVLHGEQVFTYHQPVYAGDRVTFRSEFTDVYAKAGGALNFIVRHTDVVRDDGVLVAEMDNTAIQKVKVDS
jgi:acyl dehydratase